MKKLLCIILALSFIFSLVSCNKKNNSGDTIQSPKNPEITEINDILVSNTSSNDNIEEETSSAKKDEEIIAAQAAYKALVEVQIECEKISDSIYNAWYFAIYKASDYKPYDYYVARHAFAAYTNIRASDVLKYTEEFLDNLGLSNDGIDNSEGLACLMTPKTAINIVLFAYTNDETFSKVSDLLSSAKESIKKLTNEYDDYTSLTTLKLYYSELAAYFEFCQTPTGTFSQLDTTIDNYESNIHKYKNELSLTLE